MNLSNHLRQNIVFSAAGVVPFPQAYDRYLAYDTLGDQPLEPTPTPAPTTPTFEHSRIPVYHDFGGESGAGCNPSWRIDGSFFGTKYFATPLFLLPDLPPLRIDVVLPDQLEWAPELWEALGASDSVHIHDHRAADLGISRYLVLLLEGWSRSYPDFERVYRALPFGSSLVVGNIGLKLSGARIKIVRNISLPSHLLSIDTLQAMWKFQDRPMPAVVDLQQLRFVKRLYFSICLVQYDGQYMAFKANTNSPSSIYHEIKVLLSLPPHPNIIGSPKGLVTVSGDSDHESNLVCGFLLEYCQLGSLQAFLPQARNSHTLSRQDQIRWSWELASALAHIHSQPGMFYSDLKMDNILLREIDGKMSIVLVDFEQSRNLYTWAPPEVFYVEWIAELSFRQLARNDDLDEQTMLEFRVAIERYFSARGVALPVLVPPQQYDNPDHGWYYPWLTSTPEEQEAGAVYCLGRALWCIFEGVGNTSNVLGRSDPHDSDSQHEFPTFTQRTPDLVRGFIKQCTAGAREWTDDGPLALFRLRGKVYPRGRTGIRGERGATVQETKAAIKNVWEHEIEMAKQFLLARGNYGKDDADANDMKLLGYLERPALKDVLVFLQNLAAADVKLSEERGWWKICCVS